MPPVPMCEPPITNAYPLGCVMPLFVAGCRQERPKPMNRIAGARLRRRSARAVDGTQTSFRLHASERWSPRLSSAALFRVPLGACAAALCRSSAFKIGGRRCLLHACVPLLCCSGAICRPDRLGRPGCDGLRLLDRRHHVCLGGSLVGAHLLARLRGFAGKTHDRLQSVQICACSALTNESRTRLRDPSRPTFCLLA